MSLSFTCNICSSNNIVRSERDLDRETPSCSKCGSTVRFRWIVYAISTAMFGRSLLLDDFPQSQQVEGLGFSDAALYSEGLARKVHFVNTFYDKEPYFDITDPNCGPSDFFDFIIASEVFEHIEPPVQVAFDNLARLLKPNGVAAFSTPWVPEGPTIEHFPNLYRWELVHLEDTTVLLNQTETGAWQVFDNLVFHGGQGQVLEMRLFSRSDLIGHFQSAGLHATFYSEPIREFGIIFPDPWSLPCIVSKSSLPLPTSYQLTESDRRFIELRAANRKIAELEATLATQVEATTLLHEKLDAAETQIQSAKGSKWVRLGRRLNLGPKLH